MNLLVAAVSDNFLSQTAAPVPTTFHFGVDADIHASCIYSMLRMEFYCSSVKISSSIFRFFWPQLFQDIKKILHNLVD